MNDQKNVVRQEPKRDELNLDNEPFELKEEDIREQIGEGDVIQTSAVLDSLMSDKRKILAITGVFILFVGSYFNFWGLYSSTYGRMSQGDLLGGYMFGGLFGKLCVVAAIASVVCICLNLFAYAWDCVLVSFAAFVIQALLIAIFGWKSLGSAVSCIVYPGLGSLICLIGLVLMILYTNKLNNGRGLFAGKGRTGKAGDTARSTSKSRYGKKNSEKE